MTITDLGKAIGVKTQEKLLLHGRRLMWRHGYSNVSLRQIAAGAEVDVALVSRYFGGKLGLFQATLDGAFTQADMKFASPQELVDAVVTIFETAPRNVEDPSVLQMMLMNAGDPDVGESVRLRLGETLQAKLEHVIGDRSSAALFMAAIMGFSVSEKILKLDGIAKVGSPEYAAQLRHMLNAALGYWD